MTSRNSSFVVVALSLAMMAVCALPASAATIDFSPSIFLRQ